MVTVLLHTELHLVTTFLDCRLHLFDVANLYRVMDSSNNPKSPEPSTSGTSRTSSSCPAAETERTWPCFDFGQYQVEDEEQAIQKALEDSLVDCH